MHTCVSSSTTYKSRGVFGWPNRDMNLHPIMYEMYVYSATSCRITIYTEKNHFISFETAQRTRGHYEKYFSDFAVPCEGMFFLDFSRWRAANRTSKTISYGEWFRARVYGYDDKKFPRRHHNTNNMARTCMTVFLGPWLCCGCVIVDCNGSGKDNGSLGANLSGCWALLVLLARTRSSASNVFGAPGVKYTCCVCWCGWCCWCCCCWMFLFLSTTSGWMASTRGGRKVVVVKLAALFLLLSSFFLPCDAANRFQDKAFMKSECFFRFFSSAFFSERMRALSRLRSDTLPLLFPWFMLFEPWLFTIWWLTVVCWWPPPPPLLPVPAPPPPTPPPPLPAVPPTPSSCTTFALLLGTGHISEDLLFSRFLTLFSCSYEKLFNGKSAEPDELRPLLWWCVE